jgi:uncharacterized membrane protein YcaP (DUF421 family)
VGELNIFFDSPTAVLRIVVVATLGYIAMIVLLRASGKRTLAQMNEYDFILTITLGASFGRVLTAKEVGLVEVVTTFACLVTLQYVFTFLHTHSPAFGRLVSGGPSLLFFRGDYQREPMRRNHVTEDHILGAVRQQGVGSLEEVEAVVLEPNGRLSVVERAKSGDGSAVVQLIGS